MTLDPIKAAVAPYMLAIKAGIAVLLLLTAFIGGCQVNAGKLADEQAAHKATKASHAVVLRDLANKTKAAEDAVKAAGEQAKAYRQANDERFKDARHEADQAKRELARALRAGTVRLRDEFTCPAARPAEGELPPLPADKMQRPTFGESARQRFLTTSPKPTKPTAGSAGSKPN